MAPVRMPQASRNAMEVIGDKAADRELKARVEAILRAGGLVVLPTETVYGVAVRADHPDALQALSKLKGRPEDRPLTWHVEGPGALQRFSGSTQMAARLAERYWPGPLTLVLPGVPVGLEAVTKDGWTGVRAPSHAATRSLLAAIDFPVVMTSANPHGEAPATDAASAAKWVGDAAELVVDGGPCPLGESSTVLKLGPGHFDILREGAIDLAALRRCAGLKIAFVCTGNTCRSPMAQVLAQKAIAARLGIPLERLAEFGFEVRSMGAFAGPGMPAADHGVRAMQAEGLDLTRHSSTPLTEETVAGLDRIFGLTHSHVDAALSRVEEAQVELLDPEGSDVPDPIGGDLEHYQACAQRIQELIERRLDEWV